MPSTPTTESREGKAPARSLTGREMAVLRHLVLGERNKEIAGALFISERTVKFHVSALMHKLGARNRTEVVKIAIVDGVVDV